MFVFVFCSLPSAGNSRIPFIVGAGFELDIEGHTDTDVDAIDTFEVPVVRFVSICCILRTAVSIPSSLACAEAMVRVGEFPESCDDVCDARD